MNKFIFISITTLALILNINDTELAVNNNYLDSYSYLESNQDFFSEAINIKELNLGSCSEADLVSSYSEGLYQAFEIPIIGHMCDGECSGGQCCEIVPNPDREEEQEP